MKEEEDLPNHLSDAGGYVTSSAEPHTEISDWQSEVFTLQLSTMSGMKTMLSSIILIGGLGIGFVLWAAVAPGEDRRREITKVRNCPQIVETCSLSIFQTLLTTLTQDSSLSSSVIQPYLYLAKGTSGKR